MTRDGYIHALKVDWDTLKPIPDTRKRYGSSTGYFWDVGKKGSGLRIYVEPVDKYSFDVSVPKALEAVFSPHNLHHLIAAGVHDKLLEEGYDPAFASAEFDRILTALGESKTTQEGAFWSTLLHTRYGLSLIHI